MSSSSTAASPGQTRRQSLESRGSASCRIQNRSPQTTSPQRTTATTSNSAFSSPATDPQVNGATPGSNITRRKVGSSSSNKITSFSSSSVSSSTSSRNGNSHSSSSGRKSAASSDVMLPLRSSSSGRSAFSSPSITGVSNKSNSSKNNKLTNSTSPLRQQPAAPQCTSPYNTPPVSSLPPSTRQLQQQPPQPPLTPPSLQSEEAHSCLDASLVMLRAAMGDDDARAYEYMFRQLNNKSEKQQHGNAANSSMDDNKPWLSLVRQIHSKHTQETSQLKRDLRLSEAKKKQYKAELRNNLSERLQFLEDRVLHRAASSNASLPGSTVTGATSQCSEEDTQTHGSNSAGPLGSHPAYEVVLQRQVDNSHRPDSRGASTGTCGVEPSQSRKEQEFSKERKELLRRLDVLEGRYMADLQEWQAEVTRLKDDSRRLLAERNHFQAQLGDGGNENFMARLKQAEKDRDEALRVLEELQDEYDLLEKQLGEAQTEAKQAKREERQAKRLYQQELQALNSPINDVEAEFQTAQEACRLMAKELKDVQEQHALDKIAWNDELESVKAKHLDATKNASEEFQAEIEALRKQLETQAQARQNEKENLLSELKTQSQTWKEEKERLRSKEQEQIEQLATLQHEKEHLVKQIDTFKEEKEELLGQAADLELQKENLANQLNTLEAELAKAAGERDNNVEETQRTLDRHSEQIKKLERLHAKEVAEIKDRYRQELEKIVSEKQKQMDSTCSGLEREVLVWKSQCSELEASLQESQQINVKHTRELSEWQETANNLQKTIEELMESEALSTQQHVEELDSLKAENASLIRQIDDLREQNESLVSDNATLKERSSDFALLAAQKVEQKVKTLQEENKLLRTTNESLTQELAKVNQDGEERISVLKSLHSSAVEATSINYQKQLEQAKHEAQKYKSQLVEYESSIRDFEHKSSETEHQWNAKLASYKNQVKELELRCVESDMLLKNEEDQWAAKAEAYQKRIKDMDRQVDEMETAAKVTADLWERERSDHTNEVTGLRRKLGACEKEYDQLKKKHAAEIQVLIRAAHSQSQQLATSQSSQSNMFASSLEKVGALHENKGESARFEQEAEIKRLQEEIARLQKEQVKQRESEAAAARQDIATSLEKYQKDISCAVRDLRGDILSVHEAVKKPDIQRGLVQPDVENLKQSVENVHSTIFDALAEVTLETENLVECRNGVQILVDKINTLLEPSNGLQRQMSSLEAMLSRVLNDHTASVTVGHHSKRHSTGGDVLVSPATTWMEELFTVKEQLAKERASREKVEKLHSERLGWEKGLREKAEKKLQELEDQAEQLAFERKMRAKAEKEIVTLNDQADAYGEEVMRLHAVITALEEKLRAAENPPANASHPDKEKKTGKQQISDHESASPMLDEVLTLAQSLTALMQGQGDEDKETTVMEMLESISDLLDKPSGDVPSEVRITTPPPKQARSSLQRHIDEDDEEEEVDEGPPLPISSPPFLNSAIHKHDNPTPPGTSRELTMVVDQLYARCQLLERERTEIMEVTLDILQSAREASQSELEAALATARRKSAEELLRVREENKKGVWRLYHRLCGSCQDGFSHHGSSGELIYSVSLPDDHVGL